MAIALPGARGLFSYLQAVSKASDHRLCLTSAFHHALADFRWIHKDLASRPTRLQELIPTAPSVTGTHDASRLGAGGVWFPSADAVPRSTTVYRLTGDGTHIQPETLQQPHPILWQQSYPSNLQRTLKTSNNPEGTNSISDFELAGSVLHHEAAAHCYDVRERTILSTTDNTNTLYWHRKGSVTTTAPTAPLLRLQALHQRYHRYLPLKDYIPGAENQLADLPSRLFHLTPAQLLQHFDTYYPQTLPWRLYCYNTAFVSSLTSAMRNKTCALASQLHAPAPPTPHGNAGLTSAPSITWIRPFKTSGTPSPSSKFTPTVTAPGNWHPDNARSAPAPWKIPYATLGKRLRHWGPRTHV